MKDRQQRHKLLYGTRCSLSNKQTTENTDTQFNHTQLLLPLLLLLKLHQLSQAHVCGVLFVTRFLVLNSCWMVGMPSAIMRGDEVGSIAASLESNCSKKATQETELRKIGSQLQTQLQQARLLIEQ